MKTKYNSQVNFWIEWISKRVALDSLQKEYVAMAINGAIKENELQEMKIHYKKKLNNNCKHKNALSYHENMPPLCPDCGKVLESYAEIDKT